MDIIGDILLSANPEEIRSFIQCFWLKNGYSIFNCILIFAQRPGAIMLATENQWMKLYGRSIKPGVNPIVILKPFGPVEFIYDYIDTYGEKELFPERISIIKHHGVESWWLSAMQDTIKSIGIHYSEANFGTRQGAELNILTAPISYEHTNRNGTVSKLKTDCSITVNSQVTDEAKFFAILHELAHLYCGHLARGNYTPKSIKFPNRQKKNLTINQCEHEAETTVDMVCLILGVTHDSIDYLAGYKDDNLTTPTVNLTEITKAADKILAIIPACITNSVFREIN